MKKESDLQGYNSGLEQRTNIRIFNIFGKCHHLFDFQFWPPDNNKNALPTPYTANEKTNVHNLYSVYPSFSPNLGVKSLKNH